MFRKLLKAIFITLNKCLILIFFFLYLKFYEVTLEQNFIYMKAQSKIALNKKKNPVTIIMPSVISIDINVLLNRWLQQTLIDPN